MKNRDIKQIIFFILIPALLPVSCASKQDALEEAPIITSATYQHTQYNGRSQAVEVSAAKEDVPPFVITYFRSEEDLENNKDGNGEAPAEVGDYYVRIERPEGSGYRQGKSIKIEYHIQKAFISINARPVQRTAYDGRPKKIEFETEPPVEVAVTYFTADGGADKSSGAGALAGQPSQRGRYRAVLVFPGNGRYMGASKEVELWIE
jgi:hypothetical protein